VRNFLSITGAILALFSTVPYLIDIVHKKTKPNIVSWITWMLLTGIATAAAFAAHQPRTALLTLASTFCTGGVVVLGLWYGIAKFSWFDGLCQAGAVLGLVLWLVFDSPLIAIVGVVAIDFIACLPTLRHAWLKPGEETWQTFCIGTAAALLTMLALTSYVPEALLYPAYLLLANSAIAAVVVYRRRQLGINLSRHGVHETLHE
jgi:hypothetical protein